MPSGRQVSEDGYMEAFVVNETEEDVWFDDFSVQSTSSFIVLETHAACPDSCLEPLGAGADGAWLPGGRRGKGEQVSLQREGALRRSEPQSI